MSPIQNNYKKYEIYTSPRPPISLPPNPNFSLVQFLFRNLPSISNFPALIDAETSKTLTFSNLKNHVLKLSQALINLNISKNHVVQILSPNSIHFPAAFFSAVAIGAVATAANPKCTTTELSKQVKDCNPKLIITVNELYNKIKHFNLPCIMLNTPQAHKLSTNWMDSAVYNYSDIIKSSTNINLTDLDQLPLTAQTDPAAIMYTSGTTGTSKGAVLTHRNLMASALMFASDQEARGESRNVFLCFLPMFHVFGLSGVLCAQLQRGNTVVVMEKYEIKKVLMAIEKHKVTHLCVVPPVVLEMIKNHEMVKEYNVSSVREIITGAAPLGKDIMEECARLFSQAVVCQGYGMTEASGIISYEYKGTCPPYNNSGSCGVLSPGVEARITNSRSGQPLSPFQTGEIWIRGPMVMKGYLNNEVATMETVDDQGWLHTGDIGYFDDKGRLYIVDRIKELIKYKGFQVAPAELEELLLNHPLVVDAAVIGLPDEKAGEVPIAYVVRSSTSLTSEQVLDFIGKQVAPFKRLRRVIFCDSIPKSPSGKILTVIED